MTRNNVSRRDFLKWTGLGAMTLASGAIAATNRKPNFLFILVDDLGWADLACYGADLHETPNIDRLASQSVRFTDAYAASPVCTPTRASIMTGKYPARLQMTVWRESSQNPPMNRKVIPPRTEENLQHDEITLAEALRDAGYYTAHVGKWHLGDAEHYPQTHGFDADIGATVWGAPNTFFYPYTGDDRFGDFRYVPGLELGEPGEYLTDRLTDEAMRIIDKVHDHPFFMHLAYHSVHTPMQAKEDVVAYYEKKITPEMNHQNPVYAAMVHSVDENVGRLMEQLDTLGITDNTVVIFYSDNGGFINEDRIQKMQVTDNTPLRSGKGCLYEGGIREPLLVRWPGVSAAGSVCNVPVSSIDLYPTLLEMAQAKGDPDQNAAMDGVNFASLVKNPDAELDRDALFWHYPHYYTTTTPVSAVRKGDWKLLLFFEDDRVELYNLADDLSEEHNLAAVRPEKAAELRGLLENWLKETNAQLPVPNPDFGGKKE